MKSISKVRKRAMTALRSVFIVVLPTLLFCLLVLEAGLRLSGRSPSNTTDGFFEPYKNSYRLRKDIAKTIKWPGYSYNVKTNALGFRDKALGPRTIGPNAYFLFLGESLTFGNGVDYEKTFAGLIGHALEKDHIDVVNLAVGGHGFLDQEELFHDFMASVTQKPAKVIICFSPLFIEGFDRPFTDIVVKNGYLFKKGKWLIPYIRIMLGDSSSAYSFFRDNIRKIQARLTDFNRIVARQLMDFYSVQNRLAEGSIADAFEASLQELDSYISSLGATSVYVYVPLSTDFGLSDLIKQSGEDPSQYDIRFYYGLLARHCEKGGTALIDLTPALKELYEKGEPINFIQDAHYNAVANQVIADTILGALASVGAPDRNGMIR